MGREEREVKKVKMMEREKEGGEEKGKDKEGR